MYININPYFNALCTIKLSHTFNQRHKKLHNVPIKWQNILINDGSFTRNLKALTGQNIDIKLLQKSYKQKSQLLRSNRKVFLYAKNYPYITFARSLCVLENVNRQNNIVYTNKPIGQSIIESNIDIHKKIYEIYCGYSNELENIFKSSKLIWGRKYKLYYEAKSYLIIQEFFSPHLINLI
uniref:Chorismate lyase n=1 Tax=Crouania attenuata TaxID=42002 RepID=A0A4D6WQK4_9FLOR|nr:hypothetical protein [Crouania attenuata]